MTVRPAIILPPALAPLGNKRRRRWVLWRWETRKGKPTKPPLRADAPSRHADATDPSTWTDLSTAVAAYCAGNGAGIGFALKNSAVAAIDLDDCRNKQTGELVPYAADLIRRAGSYAEITPSNEGARIIGLARGRPLHRKFNVPGANGLSVEVYRQADRFITVTGLQIGDATKLVKIDKILDGIVTELDGEKKSNKASKNKQIKQKHDLDALIKDGCGTDFGGDRSRAVWYVIHQLLKQGKSADEIARVLLDPQNGISEHCLHQSRPEDYVAKQIEKAQQDRAENGSDDVDAEIKRLAGLPPVQYEQQRKAAAEKLGVRTSMLDKLVKAERPSEADGQGRSVEIVDEQPWPDQVDGAEQASELAKAVRTYVVMPDTTADMIALWAVHTWAVGKFTISPRLAATSPTNGCGKTTLLRFLRHVVRRGKRVGSISPPALFRAVEQFHPTLLLDETEKHLDLNSDLHALINEGHCQGATVWRVLGEKLELREFAIFGALAFARNGPIPNDLEQRSIVVSLKRRLADESLSPLSEARPRPPALEVLARKCARWAQDNGDRLGEIDPGEMINRAGDNWVPLFAIAEAIGGDWPERVRKAAVALAPREHDTIRIMLLADIRTVEFDHEGDRDRLWSEDLVDALLAMEGHPWAELGKARKPLTKNRLAGLLEDFKIAPDSVRIGERTKKGYYRDQFNEAWQRYLSPLGSSKTEHRNNADEMGTSSTFKTEQAESHVPFQKCEKPANDGPCSGVPFQKGGEGEDARVCEHCGAPERPDDPVQECWVDGEQHLLHRGCRDDWLGPTEGLPAGSKVVGIAPGQRCELCGTGRDVYLIRLPVEQEAAPRHKHCAAHYWAKR